MKQIGAEIAKMHLADIIHGDLTTSNMMLRKVDEDESPEFVCLHYGFFANTFKCS